MAESQIQIVLLGLGYMGLRALFSLVGIRDYLQTRGIEFTIIALADKSEEIREKLKGICEALLLVPRPMIRQTFQDILDQCRGELQSGIPTLVYDATPSHFHYDNLLLAERHRQTQNVNLIYLGEKPLLMDYDQLEPLQQVKNFYCDFIELASLTYAVIQDYIRTNDFKISRMCFWRQSSMGLKKLLQPGARFGVTGGALEDKGPHDLSITAGLLGLEDIADFTVKSARVDYFLPASIYALTARKPIFLTATGRARETIFCEDFESRKMLAPEQEPGTTADATADAEFSTEVTWGLRGGRTAEAVYSFSWIGATQELRRKMRELGFAEGMWLGNEVWEPQRGAGVAYTLEDARIGVIEGLIDLVLVSELTEKLQNLTEQPEEQSVRLTR